jgi:hypothetical protein
MTDVASEEATKPTEEEWGLILALSRCALASRSEAAEHQVHLLASFYGDSPRGDVLREMLARKDRQIRERLGSLAVPAGTASSLT